MLNATFIRASICSAILMAASAAYANPQKCPPGSYWDTRDNMCIYDNGR
ncbi:hypothetical protein [Shimia litoralis]|nr:hypothetical protein [Shimia litoralis]